MVGKKLRRTFRKLSNEKDKCESGEKARKRRRSRLRSQVSAELCVQKKTKIRGLRPFLQLGHAISQCRGMLFGLVIRRIPRGYSSESSEMACFVTVGTTLFEDLINQVLAEFT